jgi:hypothetical protein
MNDQSTMPLALIFFAGMTAASTAAPAAQQGGPIYDTRAEYWVDGPDSIQPGSDRGFPDVAVGPNGTVVHVWQAFTANRHDIFFRRFNRSDEPAGNPAPPPQRVNTLTDDDQTNPRIAIRADGDFFVVWQSDEPDPTQGGSIRNWVRGQFFAADGTPQGSEQLISEVASGTSGDINATVAALDNGRFAVTWSSINGFGSDSQPCLPNVPPGCESFSVQARIINATGSVVGSQFQINEEVDSSQFHPTVLPVNDGGFVVFWDSFSGNDGDPSSGSIQGRRFTADGDPLGGDFQVNTTTAGSQDSPEAAIDDDGRMLVVFESPNAANTATSVRARLYSPALAPLGSDFLVPNLDAAVDQLEPRVAGGSDYFLVAWTVFGGVGSDTDFAINGRITDENGQFNAPQFQINVYEPASQLEGAVGAHGPDALVSWRSSPTNAFESDDGIIARGFAFILDELFSDRFESP